MSEFLAEATVRIRPDTTRFRADLQEQVNRAVSQVKAVVPIQFVTGGVGAAATTASLVAAQTAAAQSTAELTGLAQIENTTFARQAVLLDSAAVATERKAGADATAAAAARGHAAAQGQVGKAAIASTAGMLGLRGAVLTAGTAFIAATVGFQALGKAIGSFIEFERELNIFRVTAGATANQMAEVSEQARALGRDITLPGVAANDAAAALTELSKAGLDVQESMDAVRGTLQLATAAQIDNAAAAELVANSVNAFQLAGTEATKVADLLAGAAAASQGSIQDMGLALKQAAAVARLTGLTVEETVTLLTELARAGLSASDAGTSLRTTLLRLVGDFPKVQEEVKRLGLRLRDVDGSIRPEFFSELGQKLQNMAPAARQATVALLGGSDAIRAIGILSRSSAAEFDALLQQVSRTGQAQEIAAAQTEGLGGSVEATKNQFADLGLTLGNVSRGPLTTFVETVGAAVGAINDLNAAIEGSEGGSGFFSTLGDLVDGVQDSFSDLNISFQQGVRAAQGQEERFRAVGREAQETASETQRLSDVTFTLGSTFGAAAQGANTLKAALAGLRRDASATQAELLRLQTEGGTQGQIVGALQADIATQRRIIAEAKAKGGSGAATAIERARRQILSDQAQIDSIVAEQEGAARQAKADAQKVRDDQDEALLTLLGQRRDDQERRVARAAATTGVQDDIRAQNNLQALIKQQIQKVRDLIKDEKARKEAIRALRIALIASRAEEERLRKEQIQQARENAQTSVELDIDLAITTGNTNAEIRARQRLVKLLQAQIKLVKRGTLEWKRLRNAIAEQNAAIEEARKEKEDQAKKGKSLAQSQFEFMQSLQGFSANLLGNLIPGFATGGLVGGSGGGGEAPSSLAQMQTRVSQAGAVAGARERGVKPVQVDTTNALLRQILRTLQGRPAAPPEIRFNRGNAASEFDTLPGN